MFRLAYKVRLKIIGDLKYATVQAATEVWETERRTLTQKKAKVMITWCKIVHGKKTDGREVER